MKIKQIARNSALFLILFSFLFSCQKYYKYSQNHSEKEKQVNSSVQEQWTLMEAKNHIVIHFDDAMKEIYEIRFDQENKSINAKMREFEGKPLELYQRVLEKRSKRSKRRNQATLSDAKQVHLFLKEYDKLNEIDIQFYVSDIFQVDATEQAEIINALAAVGITAGVTTAGLVGVLLIACNCPHVYIENGNGLEFNNTLFTGAKAPQLERFDFKELPDYFPESNQFTLNIVNEDKEDQYTNLVELITVLHSKDVEVISDKNGNIHTIRQLIAPTSITDKSNTSLNHFLRDRDSHVYSFNPSQVTDLPEVLMSFDAAGQKEDAKLVLKARNTLWSGYVYNEFNKLFGKNFAKWVEMNKDKTKEEREKWMREQGIKMLVDIKINGEWTNIDEVEVFGEASMNQIVIPIKRELFGDQLEVRLRSGYQFWELDYVGVDFTKNEEVEILVSKPTSAIGNNGQDYTQQLSFDDDLYMKHQLDQDVNTTNVVFKSLPVGNLLKRSFILKSKGYYVPKTEYTGLT